MFKPVHQLIELIFGLDVLLCRKLMLLAAFRQLSLQHAGFITASIVLGLHSSLVFVFEQQPSDEYAQ